MGINSLVGQRNLQIIGNIYMIGKNSVYNLMRQENMIAAIRLTEIFLSTAIQGMKRVGTPSIEGIHFEKYLKLLL